MKATFANLKKVVSMYGDNYDMMVKTTGTPEHNKYVRKERKLDRINIQLLRDLKVYLKDPCGLSHRYRGIDCSRCSGWTKVIALERKRNNSTHLTVMAKEGEGLKCEIKMLPQKLLANL